MSLAGAKLPAQGEAVPQVNASPLTADRPASEDRSGPGGGLWLQREALASVSFAVAFTFAFPLPRAPCAKSLRLTESGNVPSQGLHAAHSRSTSQHPYTQPEQ